MKKLLTLVFIVGTYLCSAQSTFYDVLAGAGNGLRFWNGNDSYKIHMGSASEYIYGPVTDYSIKTNMSSGTPGRGWTWGVTGQIPVAAINTLGNMQIAGTFTSGSDIQVNANTNGGIRIGKAGDAGNLTVALDAQTVQYNLDFSGYRDIATDQIGARISAIRFNNYGANNALKQSAGLAFYTNPTGNNSGATDLQERIRVTPDGKVGIGTNAPLADLHLGSTNDGGIRIGKAGDAGNLTVALDAQTVQYNLDFSGYRDIATDQIGARISAIRFNNYGANNALKQSAGLAFYTNPTGNNSGATDLQERIRVTPDGNVGIGTTNPTQKLTVKGTVYSTEVKVDISAGADFVFEKNYHLLSLDSIKTYIDQHKHLPEVPSAKEMEANGVNLGEMNMVLLKKMEEMTLYIIDQEKRIAELENKHK